jgi:hypothetical protein
MQYGVWWVRTEHHAYGHATPIGGKWCQDSDGWPWAGSREDASALATRMARLHRRNEYEVRARER